MNLPPLCKIHPTAMVETGVLIGDRTSVWDNVHIRGPSRIGSECIVGGKSYVAYDVVIGDRVKINSFVYICTGVTIEDGVMISAGCVFTNDRFPRATDSELGTLRSSEPGQETLATLVREGATLGARAVIGPGIEIGRFAMVGMGAVVTRSVPPFHLVVGSPARSVGTVCRCGAPTARFNGKPLHSRELVCEPCGARYSLDERVVTELQPA